MNVKEYVLVPRTEYDALISKKLDNDKITQNIDNSLEKTDTSVYTNIGSENNYAGNSEDPNTQITKDSSIHEKHSTNHVRNDKKRLNTARVTGKPVIKKIKKEYKWVSY